MTGPVIGSLFTGYGGIDLGLRQIWPSVRTAWVSDIKTGANKVLAHRFPDTPNLGDITTIHWAEVAPVDIITGGSPCQDLSNAGKRMGMSKDTRSGLWASMLDGIAALRPALVIWENVRGAYRARADSSLEPCQGCVGDAHEGPVLRALGRVLGDLATIGYDAAWVGLRASDVGAPHGRFRVFILAWPAGTEGQQWDQTALSLTPHAAIKPLLPTPAINDMGAGKTVAAWTTWTDAMRARHANGNGHGKSLSIEVQRIAPYLPAMARWETVIERPAPPATEPTGKDGSERLSPRFVEWMMGLPAGWITETPDITRSETLSLGGDGVVPQQCAAAVEHLIALRDLYGMSAEPKKVTA